MKIPFERTISGAYRFAFSNILSVIGIGWFPYLLLIALIGGLGYSLWPQLVHMFETLKAAKPGQPPDFEQFRPLFSLMASFYGLILPAAVIASAMVTVGVLRKALGQHPGPVFFFFSLGSQVWRLIGGYILLGIVFYGLLILLGGGVVGLWFALDSAAKNAAWPVTVIVGIAAALFMIYAFVRAVFFLPAVVVAENHIGLRRSWHLGGGNFWRIVGIYLIVTLPLAFANNILISTIVQFIGLSTHLPTMPEHPTPEQVQAFFGALWALALRAGPAIVILEIVVMALGAGLKAGAVASAYNLVTGGPDIAPPKAPA